MDKEPADRELPYYYGNISGQKAVDIMMYYAMKGDYIIRKNDITDEFVLSWYTGG